jgi:hypothetical protein
MKRPSLAAAVDVITADSEIAFHATDLIATPAEGRRGNIMVRLPFEARHALRQLALDRSSTVQALMIEAINLLMIKYEKPPLL